MRTQPRPALGRLVRLSACMSAVYCVMPRMSAGAAAADAVTSDSAEALAARPIIFKSTGPGIEALQTAGAVARFTITAQEATGAQATSGACRAWLSMDARAVLTDLSLSVCR